MAPILTGMSIKMYISMLRNSGPSALLLILVPVVAILSNAAAAEAKQCTASDYQAATAGPPATKQMLSYQTLGAKRADAGNIAAANQVWISAYQYAVDHCYPLDPDGANNLLLNGNARQAVGKYRLRLSWLSPTQKESGFDAPFANGLNAAQTGDLTSAAAAFRQSLKLLPGDPNADFMLGTTLFAQGDRAAAIQQWRLTLADSQPAAPESENFGPDQAWLWALQLVATQQLKCCAAAVSHS
jgi:tetratricopeptide (TPR) repeat protein